MVCDVARCACVIAASEASCGVVNLLSQDNRNVHHKVYIVDPFGVPAFGSHPLVRNVSRVDFLSSISLVSRFFLWGDTTKFPC